MTNSSRRTFLTQMGSLTLGFTLFPSLGCETHKVTPLILGKELDFITNTKDLFIQNGGAADIKGWKQPTISQQDWSLSIESDPANLDLVKNPITLRFSDLEKIKDKEISILKTLRCVFDFNNIPGFLGNGLWTGVPLKHFLDQAQIDRTKAKRIRIFGEDGFRNNITLDSIYGTRDNDLFEPLLVTHFNGEPLTPEHGFPVRLLIHETYGFKNIKWIRKMVVTEDNSPFGNYQDNGFQDDGIISVLTKVTAPTHELEVPAGKVKVLGMCLSGFGGLSKIEVQLNNEPFKEVPFTSLDTLLKGKQGELVKKSQQVIQGMKYPFRAVWTPCVTELELAPGTHTIRMRGTDSKGNVQVDDDKNPADGFSSVPTIKVKALTEAEIARKA